MDQPWSPTTSTAWQAGLRGARPDIRGGRVEHQSNSRPLSCRNADAPYRQREHVSRVQAAPLDFRPENPSTRKRSSIRSISPTRVCSPTTMCRWKHWGSRRRRWRSALTRREWPPVGGDQTYRARTGSKRLRTDRLSTAQSLMNACVKGCQIPDPTTAPSERILLNGQTSDKSKHKPLFPPLRANDCS